MINLCYLKNPNNTDEILTFLFPYLNYDTDFIITPNLPVFKKRNGIRIFAYDELDLETLAGIKLKNIILLDFGLIDTSYLQNLITLKAKSSEIIGLSSQYSTNKHHIKQLLEIKKYKKQELSDDQIIIALMLTHNFPSIYAKICVNHYNNTKTSGIKIISELSEVLKYLKT